MCHIVTVDELSWRLKRAQIARMFDREAGTTGYPLPRRLPNRGTISGSLRYVNHRFCLGISELGDGHMSEDAQACILFDLANMPINMVCARLRQEGAKLE